MTFVLILLSAILKKGSRDQQRDPHLHNFGSRQNISISTPPFFNSKTSLNQATALSLKPAFLEKLHSNKGRCQFKRRHKIKKSIKLAFNQTLVFCYDLSTWRSCIIINYRKVDNETTVIKRSIFLTMCRIS